MHLNYRGSKTSGSTDKLCGAPGLAMAPTFENLLSWLSTYSVEAVPPSEIYTSRGMAGRTPRDLERQNTFINTEVTKK